MLLKTWFHRFRSWQKEPREWPAENLGGHRCANCGYSFIGNFCPVCGQGANEGRVDWLSLRRIVMMVWGLDSRSMLYSLWQLIWRPGYLIGEYISGHRQVSFPPVKMLFIMAIFYAVFVQLTGIDQGAGVEQAQGQYTVLNTVLAWLNDHPAWSMLSITLNMVLPTWALFRFSPRNTRHTLPEGVTVQLFMSTLLLMIILVEKFTSGWLALLNPFYYYVCYRQLFGYRFWGTLWRTLTSFFTGFIMVIIVFAMIILVFDRESIADNNGLDVISYIVAFLVFIAIVASILFVGALIGRRTYRKRLNQSSTK